MNDNPILESLSLAMKNAGFKKKGNSWYARTKDCVLVANLQKSNYGQQYYVNLGIWLLVLGDAEYPKEYQCHVRLRASALDTEHRHYWEGEIFNLEYKGISELYRTKITQTFFEEEMIPFLNICGSLCELRRMYREGFFKQGGVVVSAQELLND